MSWLVNVIASAGLPTPDAPQRLAAERPVAEQWDILARTAGISPTELAALAGRLAEAHAAYLAWLGARAAP